MSNENSSVFDPVAEAKAFDWKSLCPSTQKALRKIFLWLNQACAANQKSKNDEQEKLASEYELPSTSILLSGDRGSGKTTVLLSAAYAYKLASEQKGDFFKGTSKQEDIDIKNVLDTTCHKVYWLDTLDLETLHPSTNLLSSILVRIRLAIEKMGDECGEKQSSRRRSILEGDLGTGEDLNRLISDATFMWESLPSNSGLRLEKSEQQIKASEISANFKNDFKSVMEKTTCLVRNRGKEQTELFVLPIDNVDRSIEHIASISKLIHLAISKRLWFILAAVRPDYQLFLERAFQKELLRTGIGTSDWDQTQSIARRQAATAMRRSLPENYQIRIEALSPYQSWTFPRYLDNSNGIQLGKQTKEESNAADQSIVSKKASSTDNSQNEAFAKLCISLLESGKTKELAVLLGCSENLSSDAGTVNFSDIINIKSQTESGSIKDIIDMFYKNVNLSSLGCSNKTEMLKKVCKLLTEPDKDKNLKDLLHSIKLYSSEDTRFQTLGDLFNITSQLDNRTRIEYLAATKTSRNDNEVPNKEIFTGAGKMALGLSPRTLIDLKTAISLYQNTKEGAVEISVRMLRNAIDESDLPFWASKKLLDHIIRKNSNDKWIIDLTNDPIKQFKQKQPHYELSYPIEPQNTNPDFYIEEKLQYQDIPDIVLELWDIQDEKIKKITLPPIIAGGFMILYDILVLCDDKRVLCKPPLPNKVFSSGIKSIHKLHYSRESFDFHFEWKTPEWPTFVEHFIFAVQWTAILSKLQSHFCDVSSIATRISNPTDNLQNILLNSYKRSTKEVNRILHLAWIDNVCSVSGKEINKWKWYKLLTISDNDDYTIEYAENVILKLCRLVSWSRIHIFNIRKTVTWYWISREFPLLFQPEYSLLTYNTENKKYKVPEICPQSMPEDKEWPESEKKKEPSPSSCWEYIKKYWDKNTTRLTASREDIVQTAIKNSEQYKSSKDPERFINDITERWFSSVEETKFK